MEGDGGVGAITVVQEHLISRHLIAAHCSHLTASRMLLAVKICDIQSTCTPLNSAKKIQAKCHCHHNYGMIYND